MLMSEIIRISNFMGESFLHIWPYLVVTIPLAVAVQMSGASKYIKRAFGAKPLTAIVLLVTGQRKDSDLCPKVN